MLFYWTLSHSDTVHATTSPKGWKWYNEPKSLPILPPPKPTPLPPNTTTTVMSATQQMQWFHQAYEEVKADATINPQDEEKYLKLMQLHHFIGEKTTQTGMTFKKLLLKYPEYSYVKDRPVEQAARSTYHQLERQKKTEMVKKMKEEGWGFFFVFEGNDALTQTLAPSMQQFADTHNIELLGISNDGVFIDDIRQNRPNDNKVIVPFTPALVLVNPNTSEFKPLAYGFISQSDLLGRFYNVATDYQSPDF
ncbi:type-F conjugative transfer system pilin assembly protein TraF [Vibrio europaeus]|uniref:type-F conjugative transfer system pilin assembly protein TraF n=1 Tax=Vibrio europaeus TaxID=300876 RepID=UPI0023407048|nr:type-F conjugative transfer system pilin assembly protein TraF [Vibrio europaeus]MDC5842223.1 type-F conjugative transfer system pilin assembly protein TraF [Vibrio europaeus]